MYSYINKFKICFNMTQDRLGLRNYQPGAGSQRKVSVRGINILKLLLLLLYIYIWRYMLAVLGEIKARIRQGLSSIR